MNTRIKQYEAYFNEKGVKIANSFVRARIQSQMYLFEKYDLDFTRGLEEQLNKLDIPGGNVEEVRNQLQLIEAQATRIYRSRAVRRGRA